MRRSETSTSPRSAAARRPPTNGDHSQGGTPHWLLAALHPILTPVSSVTPPFLRSPHFRRSTWFRLTLPIVLLLFAACSGSDDEQPGSDASPSSSESTASSGTGGPAEDLADAYWQPPVTVDTGVLGAGAPVLRSIDDELWAIIRRLNGAGVYRSSDAGVSWSPVDVAPPPADGGLVLTDIVRGDSGRYLISGTIESRCQFDIESGEGFRFIGECRDHRPVVFVSDDGDAWRRVEPSAMAPPGDAAVVIESIVADKNGFLAAGTVMADDWHARLWSSPDGETWTLEREVRDETDPMSAQQVLSDGSTVVLLTELHPCADPWVEGSIGWYLGAGARRHTQIFAGSTAANVEFVKVGEHPLAVAPTEVDCTLPRFTNPFPHPRTIGAHVGDTIALLQIPPPPADDEVVSALEPYQVATLTEGTWTVAQIEQLPVDPDAAQVRRQGLLDVDGRLGLLFRQEAGYPLVEFTAILPEGDGTWAPLEFGRPLVASTSGPSFGHVWSNGSLLLVGTLRVDPYHSTAAHETAQDVLAWRSIDGEDWVPRPCELAPGGACQFTDLSRLDGYPDFAGRDLSGIDLSFSDLGQANFDGANLRGARLWDASGWLASFVGADLTEAAVQSASLGDVSGANFTDANLGRTGIGGADGAVFEGAILQGTRFEFRDRPPIPAAGWPGAWVIWSYEEDDSGPYELSLAGVDLTDMRIEGSFADVPLLRITDLTGATLIRTSFTRVDLSAIDPATVDLSEVDFDEGSICPDGLPPDDTPLGTCVR